MTGAGEGNRTLVSSLGSYSSTIELRPRRRCSLFGGPAVAQEIGVTTQWRWPSGTHPIAMPGLADGIFCGRGFSPDAFSRKVSGLKPLLQCDVFAAAAVRCPCRARRMAGHEGQRWRRA